MKNKKGFTFLELITTLSLMLILTIIAIPSGQYLLETTRANGTINQIFNAYHFARSEAITRGEIVTFCGTSDKHSCNGNWQSGQIIFVDKKGNHHFDADDEMLRDYPPLKGKAELSLRAFPSSDYLQLKPSGYNKQQNGTFVYCSKDRDKQNARAMVISKSGRIRKIDPSIKTGTVMQLC